MHSKFTITVAAALVLSAVIGMAGPSTDGREFWPAWRGPLGTGEAPKAEPPMKWSESKNIRWKAKVPGRGHATPVIWDDLVFILAAVPTDKAAGRKGSRNDVPEGMKRMLVDSAKVHRFEAFAYQRKDGAVRWQRTLVEEAPHEGTHRDGTWASPSPVTDGKHVFVSFGSRGIFCLDMEGKKVWSKDLGDMQVKMTFGEGSSPVLCGEALIVNWDHEGDSFIVALSKKNGEELWRKPRDERTSWSTPLVVAHEDVTQIIVSATGRVRGYNPPDGRVLWECGGMTANVVPTPVFGDGMVYVTSGFRGNALLAIRLAKAIGDITDSGDAIAWRHGKDTPYVPSPLLYRGSLYFLSGNKGSLSCFDATTGKAQFSKETLEGLRGVYASPVGADGRIYIAGRNGATAVLKHGPKLEVLAVNELDTRIDASPAAADKELYLRGTSELYCIAEE